MIPQSEISKCPEFKVKSKITKLILFLRVWQRNNKSSQKWTRIHINYYLDVYYTEKLLAVEIDEKGQEDRDLIFEEKIQKALEEKLGCELW